VSTFWWYQTRYSFLPSFLPQAAPLLVRTNLIIFIKAHHLHVTDLVKKIVNKTMMIMVMKKKMIMTHSTHTSNFTSFCSSFSSIFIIFIKSHHLHVKNLVKKIVNKMMMMKIMTHFIHTSNFTSFAHHFHQMPSSNAIIFM
jgi:hypothetical protein